ncbi:hypothetical protein KP509_36G017100 [Ceratopteris richardii]|uniref:Glutaredoxin domain-containing protein n=1 Tax=Ceratopteris richardii TaxID=49495 RepID=A0A8T2QB50_CERRI|nr:hypothetical protein KP509_36G017100 [Ceratopteris richardii]
MAASTFATVSFSLSSVPSSSENSHASLLHTSRCGFIPTPLYSARLPHLKFSASKRFHRASFGPIPVRSMSDPSSLADLENLIKSKNSENAVVIYSKSWCPYCLRVKDLFKQVRVKPLIIELDALEDGQEVQDALQRITGQSTVPNVFIGGKHVGGCEDTLRLHHYDHLIPLLKDAGAKFL